MRQGVLISTTEHILSALVGMGVDNAIIEINSLFWPTLTRDNPTGGNPTEAGR